ncbi:MAG: phage replisome organizer N-terminal domain-containing protein [Armatimonadota bacterium]
MHWFRFPHKAAHDPRLLRLPPDMRWCWVMILTTASESPRRGWLLLEGEVPATVDDLAYLAGVKPRIMEQAIGLLVQYRLLESVDGLLHVAGWEETQFESDSSAKRTRKWRTAHDQDVTSPERHDDRHKDRHGDGPETETDSETETETDTETETPPGTGRGNRGAGTPAEAPVVSLTPVSSSPRKSAPRRARQEVEYPPWFEAIWAACPRQVEKERTLAVCQARLKDGHTAEELLAAIVNYGRQCQADGTEECYIKHPATFFGPQRPFVDWRDRHGDCAQRPAGQISRRAARGGSYPLAPGNWEGCAGGVE